MTIQLCRLHWDTSGALWTAQASRRSVVGISLHHPFVQIHLLYETDDKSVIHIYMFLFDISNSLPDLFIGFTAVANYPQIFFPALGALYILDYSSAAVNDYLSNNIIRLTKELDLVKAKKDKVTQHDVASGVKIKQDSSISEMRNETWVNIFEEQRDIWSILGNSYLPSVLYKVRMVVFEDTDSLEVGADVIRTEEFVSPI